MEYPYRFTKALPKKRQDTKTHKDTQRNMHRQKHTHTHTHTHTHANTELLKYLNIYKTCIKQIQYK